VAALLEAVAAGAQGANVMETIRKRIRPGRHYAPNSFTDEDPITRRDVASCSLPCQQLDISELVEGASQRKASVLLFQTTLSRTNCVNARRNAYFELDSLSGSHTRAPVRGWRGVRRAMSH
jgi:hypothetical protein